MMCMSQVLVTILTAGISKKHAECKLLDFVGLFLDFFAMYCHLGGSLVHILFLYCLYYFITSLES